MKHLLYISFVAAFMFACEEKPAGTGVFTPDNQAFQEFTILPDQMDTVLLTAGGVRIHPVISDEVFDVGAPITVSIKEFISLEDMVLAGLSTVGEEGLLESRGMFYLELSQHGQPITLTTPWKAEIPVEFIEDGFESFVAEGDETGPGIWSTSAKQLQSSYQQTALEWGDSAYHTSCAPCHKIRGRLVGPQLGGAAEKYNWDWLVRFTQNAPKMIAEGDSLAVCVWNEYGKAAMPSSKYLDEEEIRNIYFYIENERRKNNYPKSEPGLCQKDLRSAMEGFAERQRIRDSIYNANPPLFVSDSGENIFSSRYYYPFFLSNGWSNCDRYYSQREAGIQTITNIKISGFMGSGNDPQPLSQVMLVSQPMTLQSFNLPVKNAGFDNQSRETIWITEEEPMTIIAIREAVDGMVGIHGGSYLLKESMELSVPLVLVPEDKANEYLRQIVQSL